MATQVPQDQIDRCTRCGKCRAVCPVFLQTNEEAMVARGRLALLGAWLRGRLHLSDRELERSIWSCIKCHRCTCECPAQINPPEVVYEAIAAATHGAGPGIVSRIVLRHLLPRRRLFDLALRCASIGQRLLPSRREGHIRHLPLFFQGGKFLPQFQSPTAIQRFAADQPPALDPGSKGVVAIFTGCLINYAYPDLIGKTIDLLKQCGYTAWIPARQVCCGMPALSIGDTTARALLARRNLESFSHPDIQYITTLCASCGKMLKTNSAYSTIAGRVRDISEILVSEKLDLRYTKDERVTYHDPCHLVWGQRITTPPRSLLKLAVTLVEHEGASDCCGGGGLFNVFYPELSNRIGCAKIEHIREADVATVVTGCPGCMMQLADQAERWNAPIRICHTVDVLWDHTKPVNAHTEEQRL